MIQRPSNGIARVMLTCPVCNVAEEGVNRIQFAKHPARGFHQTYRNERAWRPPPT